MSALIPKSHEALLNSPTPATLATRMPDGQPQLTIIWLDDDGHQFHFTTVRGWQKEKT